MLQEQKLNIVISQDAIEAYENVARDFFLRVLGMNSDEALITDEAMLRDYSFSGDRFPDVSSGSLNEAYAAWDRWVLNEIEKEYGITLSSTRISLIALFAQVEAVLNAPKYLH